ncbi:MAG: nucleotidyl transferase AbiEii/AbiGii toxin family protein [Deltaproteobacteria bacterium]|nr:nucleotidyl transferase AbiEii/AbiGii toxin family protein [Deltaproteobacteria bacterium]
MLDLRNSDYLLPETRKLLAELIGSATFLDKYVLVGGTALSLHLCHRKSEDLDFFTYNDNFEKKEIFDYINSNQFATVEILNQTNEQIDLLINGVKVTFFNAKWTFLTPDKIKRFNLSSLEAIAGMKVNTLFLRAKFRDYYDLYFLVKKGMTLQEIFHCAKNVITGVSFKMMAIALVYIDDIEDENIAHLEPKSKISITEIRSFFEKKLSS